MPGSLPNPILYFPAKIAIYALVGWILNKIYKAGPNPLLFGFLRVVIGFGVGFILLIAVTASGSVSGTNSSNDYVWLFVTRIVVWSGIVWIFYERKGVSLFRFFVVIIAGVLLSFGVDLAFTYLDKEFSGLLSIPMC